MQLKPFSVSSSSAMLVCWTSPVGQNHHASSSTVPLLSNTPPIAREFASTHAFSSPVTQQIPQICHLGILLSVLQLSVAWERHLSWCHSTHLLPCLPVLIVSVSKWSHPQTGKYPTNFPLVENTTRHVSVTESSGTELLQFYAVYYALPLTSSPNTRVLSFNPVGFLLVKPKDSSLFVTSLAGNMSLMCPDVTLSVHLAPTPS